MSNVHLSLSADALLNMTLLTRQATREPEIGESQVRLGSSGNVHPYLFVTAADARAIALAFHVLAVQIDEADAARDTEQLQPAGVS